MAVAAGQTVLYMVGIEGLLGVAKPGCDGRMFFFEG